MGDNGVMTRVVRLRARYAVLPLLLVGSLVGGSLLLGGCSQVADTAKSAASHAVSYTHLTLPTSDLV